MVLDVFTGIVPLLLAYIVMALIVPEEPTVGAQRAWASSTTDAQTLSPGARAA